MNKVVLALVVVLAAFVNAQYPPAAQQTCVSVTGISFCTGVVSYSVLNNTVSSWTAADNTAKTQYTTAVGLITNNTACSMALQTYYCQANFPRCTTYASFPSVAASRCSAVNSACNVTGFPSGSFPGSPCVVNTQASVDGTNLCAPQTTVALSNACNSAYAFGTTFVPVNGTFQNTLCPVNSFCNTTDPNPTCLRPNNLGDACPTGTCYNGPLGGIATLQCIAGSCQYYGKRNGYACLTSAECMSNNCTAGVCYESPQFGWCASNINCRQGLYCDLFNQTCYAQQTINGYCGTVQANWTPVPCASGLTCVRGTGNQTLSTCVSNAQLGANCSVATGAIVYNSPLCISTSVSTTYTCVNNICTSSTPGVLGAACNGTTPCASTLTCNYVTPTAGVCATPSSVACGGVAGTPQCNTYQTCSCGSSLASLGTCTPAASNPYSTCASQVGGLLQCLLNNCGAATAPFMFYDNYSCGSQSCNSSVNALLCCAQTAVGTNFVAPKGFSSSVCGSFTPTPTPGPTTTGGPTSSTSGPTSTGTGTATPVPIQSSKKSGAVTTAISMIAMLVAIVAYCL